MTALPRRIPPAVPRSGVVLGRRYRLVQPLGVGGTADVFQGVDLRLRRDVAVKIFRPGACAVTAERFCQEAELLGRLSHPALVPVHDAGRHASSVYVVMRLVEGVTLREHILDGPLPSDRVARLGARLASALEHVHAAGVVHRDVKPSNILIGLDGAPHLTDFGISRLVDEPTRSLPGTLVGTIPYLAPEQLLGHGSGPASDIHALGLVLLEALKGEREYPGGPFDVGAARALRPPQVPTWTSVELASTLEAMTHTDPARRPDAAACVHLLETAAASAGSDTADAMNGIPARKHAGARPRRPAASATTVVRRRHRIPAAGLAVGLALGVGGTTLYYLFAAGAASDPEGARPAPPATSTPNPGAPAGSPPAPIPATPPSPPIDAPDATAPGTTPPAPPTTTPATPARNEPGRLGTPGSLTTTEDNPNQNDDPKGKDNGKGGSKSGKSAK